jgi:hypothetical protein
VRRKCWSDNTKEYRIPLLRSFSALSLLPYSSWDLCFCGVNLESPTLTRFPVPAGRLVRRIKSNLRDQPARSQRGQAALLRPNLREIFPPACRRCPEDRRTNSSDNSDRHPVAVEFMIFVISALTGAKVGEIMNELDCCDPFHHLETEFIFAAQP